MSIGSRLCFAASALLIAGSLAAPAATCMPDTVTAALYDGANPSKKGKATVCVRDLDEGPGGGQTARLGLQGDDPFGRVKSRHAFHPFSSFGGGAGHDFGRSHTSFKNHGDPDEVGPEDEAGDTPDVTGPAAVPPPAPVPLPAAGWMLLAGLAGLGLIRRRSS